MDDKILIQLEMDFQSISNAHKKENYNFSKILNIRNMQTLDNVFSL